MSASASPSLVAGSIPDIDEANLPHGNCRYIMMMPEIKGNRCACVNFTLNKSMPGATCECGHLACFHHRTVEPPIDRQEVELLRQRVQQLEDRLSRDNEKESGAVQRVSDLEEIVETRTEEICQEIKKTYGNLNRAWHSIGQLERRTGEQDRHFQGVGAHLQNVDGELRRLHQRQCELNDADLSLEERLLEVLDQMEEDSEEEQCQEWARRGRSRRNSTSDSATPTSTSPVVVERPRGRATDRVSQPAVPVQVPTPVTPSRPTAVPFRSLAPVAPAAPPASAAPPAPPAPVAPPAPPALAAPAASECWTVHVSLLPNDSLPFPFERNTNAYKRCLSRGLHQMVAVRDTSAEAFLSAVSAAFSRLLRNRPWVPLQAKLCDAATLQGLPMLRPLDASLTSAPFDEAFLHAHCAVLDAHGKIDSLYIAMQHDATLSWHDLRHAPVFLPGLEASWEYDAMLDANDPFEDDDHSIDAFRPSAGDLVVGRIPNLKRAASEISRSSSFGAGDAVPLVAANLSTTSAAASSSAVVGERPSKVARTPCPLPHIPDLGRRQRIGTA